MEELRKSAQEVEIDHLLAEEFSCDILFGARFLQAAGIDGEGFRTSSVLVEPSLAGEGFGDLLVEGSDGSRRMALLIEDKITASAAVRQAARYAAHAERLRASGWDLVWTILVAPSAYQGESREFDARVNLETVSSLMTSPDPMRLAYRRAIIDRALRKRRNSGVKVADPSLHYMKSRYLEFVRKWCAEKEINLSFPQLRKNYFDGDSWIEPIRDGRLPNSVRLRHRLWTSVRDCIGQVDLIACPADEFERAKFMDDPPQGAISSSYSKGKGVQVSFQVPEMRQASGFSEEAASAACDAMQDLLNWYLKLR